MADIKPVSIRVTCPCRYNGECLKAGDSLSVTPSEAGLFVGCGKAEIVTEDLIEAASREVSAELPLDHRETEITKDMRGRRKKQSGFQNEKA